MIKLTKQQARRYKQRWEQIQRVETQELQTAPVSLKFKQLCFLMNSFHPIESDREKEVNATRTRWVKLKKNGGQ